MKIWWSNLLIHTNFLTMISISLFLPKGVYAYEYMDDWEKLSETSLPVNFYSRLNMEETTDADYVHTKKVG